MSETFRSDLGKLILRIAVGGLMLFHGVHKLISGHEHIAKMLSNAGLPTFLQYGVPVGEVLAPILIILGILTAPSALVIAFTMLFSIYLAYGEKLFTLNAYGGWAPELNVLFMFAAISISLIGPGRLKVPINLK